MSGRRGFQNPTAVPCLEFNILYLGNDDRQASGDDALNILCITSLINVCQRDSNSVTIWITM